MAKRRVVQIAAATLNGRVPVVYALCNDGTMWAKIDGKWLRIEDVPERVQGVGWWGAWWWSV